MSFSRASIGCGILAAALAPAGGAVTSAEILARMDRAAARFKQMAAEVKRTTHIAVLNEDEPPEMGRVRMRRMPTGEIQGLVELTKPDRKFYSFKRNTLKIYTPAINTVQVFD